MNLESLKYWLRPKSELFDDFKNFTLDADDPDGKRIFIDRGSDILFVAHIDTVQVPKFMRLRKTKSKKTKRIYARGLDDRLGCMIANELSEQLNVDLLLCDNEEIGDSTGQYHYLKEYKWIAEFDRAGDDVVTYGRENEEFISALEEFWSVGAGTYSDICSLDTPACCVNVGIGFELAHSKDSYANLKVMDQQVKKFREFFQKYKNIKFVANEVADVGLNDWEPDAEFWDSLPGCDACGSQDDVWKVFGYYICKACFEGFMVEAQYNGLNCFQENEYYSPEIVGLNGGVK